MPTNLENSFTMTCSSKSARKSSLTRGTGTVHTSAKARLTSVAIWIRIRIHDPDCYQNLIISSSTHCQPSLNMTCKSFQKFLYKVANGQTGRQQRLHNFLGRGKDTTTPQTCHYMWRVGHFSELQCQRLGFFTPCKQCQTCPSTECIHYITMFFITSALTHIYYSNSASVSSSCNTIIRVR